MREGIWSYYRRSARDLFGLYYVADPKLVELGLTPSADAYKAQYYTYLMNGFDDTACTYRAGVTM